MWVFSVCEILFWFYNIVQKQYNNRQGLILLKFENGSAGETEVLKTSLLKEYYNGTYILHKERFTRNIIYYYKNLKLII